MKGQLAYKDINGMVWLITETNHAEFTSTNTEGFSFVTAHSIYDAVYAIDERYSFPEWTKQIPAKSIQTEQLDFAAYPESERPKEIETEDKPVLRIDAWGQPHY